MRVSTSQCHFCVLPKQQDTKIGDPGDDDPDAEVDAEAQAPLQIHEDAAPADDDDDDQAARKKKKKRSQRTEDDRIEFPNCEKKIGEEEETRQVCAQKIKGFRTSKST